LFTALPNTGAAPRTGSLTVAGKTFTVAQLGTICSFSLNLAGAVVPASGLGSGSFTIATPTAGCAATAVSYSGWIGASAVFSGKSGTGNYSVQPNLSGSRRTGVIRVGDQSFEVNQDAAKCSFTLDASGAVFDKSGGSGMIVATASEVGCVPALGPAGFVVTGPLLHPSAKQFAQPYGVPDLNSESGGVRTSVILFGGKSFTVKQTSW
jgi:hypothetical protein